MAIMHHHCMHACIEENTDNSMQWRRQGWKREEVQGNVASEVARVYNGGSGASFAPSEVQG